MIITLHVLAIEPNYIPRKLTNFHEGAGKKCFGKSKPLTHEAKGLSENYLEG